MEIDKLAQKFHLLAVEKGWYDDENPALLVKDPREIVNFVSKKLMLCVTELAEAMEEVRVDNLDTITFRDDGKPEGFIVELADTIIRIGDLWAALKLAGLVTKSLGEVVNMKHVFNMSRPHRHGNKRA